MANSVKVPFSAISFAAFMTPLQAIRANAPPTLIRRTLVLLADHEITRDELFARMVFAMGGRSAEELVFGAPTTGASNDIERATQMARAMVCRWGMSDKLGMVQLAPHQRQQFIDIDRLADVIAGACGQALVAVALHRLGRHRDDRQVLPARLQANQAGGLVAVHHRHLAVQQHGIDALAAQQLEILHRGEPGRRRQ